MLHVCCLYILLASLGCPNIGVSWNNWRSLQRLNVVGHTDALELFGATSLSPPNFITKTALRHQPSTTIRPSPPNSPSLTPALSPTALQHQPFTSSPSPSIPHPLHPYSPSPPPDLHHQTAQPYAAVQHNSDSAQHMYGLNACRIAMAPISKVTLSVAVQHNKELEKQQAAIQQVSP